MGNIFDRKTATPHSIKFWCLVFAIPSRKKPELFRRQKDLPIFCENIMSSLNDRVYEFVKNIPRGKVATYGQIALHLGNRNFARVVGNILHGNPDPEHIPCHRVVNAQGRLSRSYAFGGIEAQRRLLVSEGAVFKNEQVVDLSISQMVW